MLEVRLMSGEEQADDERLNSCCPRAFGGVGLPGERGFAEFVLDRENLRRLEICALEQQLEFNPGGGSQRSSGVAPSQGNYFMDWN